MENYVVNSNDNVIQQWLVRIYSTSTSVTWTILLWLEYGDSLLPNLMNENR